MLFVIFRIVLQLETKSTYTHILHTYITRGYREYMYDDRLHIDFSVQSEL